MPGIAGRVSHEQRATAPAPRMARGNLPALLSTLIGRQQALLDLQELIGTARLVTLTGAGGVGKTRLALELAAGVADRFTDGAWLVELAPLSDPTHIAQAIAGAVGLKEQPGRPLDEVVMAALGRQEILLVLDNCEHLIGGCADLAHRLLRACPGLRILATSR